MSTERDSQTYAIIGAAMAVHATLGSGFLEGVYHDAMAVELGLRDLPFAREVAIPITYKGTLLSTRYRADFVCFGDVIVELKAIATLGGREEAQVIHYLKATGYPKALLLNFGGPSLQYKRLTRFVPSLHRAGRTLGR